MPPRQNLTGMTFGNLKVLEYTGSEVIRGKNAFFYNVLCICGNTKVMHSESIKKLMYNPGQKKNSCRECNPNAFYRKEYVTWNNMKGRCYNKNDPRYPDWGGRGIVICDEWRYNFWEFLAHIGKAPSDDHTIEREDNNGNYEPGNVRWATQSEQRLNQRGKQTRSLYGIMSKRL